ncbi:MAG: pectate lyase [Polyangiaceae bacterium]
MKRSQTRASAFALVLALAGCAIQPQSSDDDSGDFDIAQDALTTRIQAESQAWTASSGDSTSATSSTLRLNANGSSDSFKFNATVASGTYAVTLRFSQRNVYGNYTVYINGKSVGTLSGYSSNTSDTWTTMSLGTLTLSGSVEFKFTSAGKASGASDYDAKLDFIDLTGSTSGSTGTGGTTSTGSGGSTAKGGSTTTGTGGSTSSSSGTIPSSIPSATGTETRSSTTSLAAGVHDFANKRIGVQNPVGCDGEGQPAVFELADGATLRNVIIAGGTPGANGVVCKGNCTLENVYWEDVCEDAATNSKDGATMTINGAIAKNATDKVFQHNAKGGSRTVIKNSYLSTFGKVWRSCGDCTSNGGPRHLEMSNVRVEGVGSCVAGANENYGDTVTIKNLYVKGGYNASSDKPKICQVFKGVTDHNGESTKLYDGASQWNTSTCKVSQSDVLSW